MLAYWTPILLFKPILDALSMEGVEASEGKKFIILLELAHTYRAFILLLIPLFIFIARCLLLVLTLRELINYILAQRLFAILHMQSVEIFLEFLR